MDNRETFGAKSNRTYTYLLSILISFFFIFDSTAWSSLSVIGATVALLAVYAVQKRAIFVITIEPFHKHILLFVLYSFFSCIWSWSASATFSRSVTVLLVFVCMAVIYMIYSDSCSLNDYLQAIMISGLIISIYTISFVGLDNLRIATEAGGRLEGDTFYANVNSMGMWMSVCTIVFVHRIVNTKFRLWYLLGILPISMIAIAQSRTALIEATLGIILVFIFKIRDSKNISKKLGTIVLSMLVLVGIAYAITNLKMFSGLYDRMRSIFGLSTVHKDGSTELRNQMIQIGLDQFKKTPLLGIGFGSTLLLTEKHLGLYTYLHNNFIEVLVSGGVIGFLIYYSMHWYIAKGLWRARARHDHNLQLCVILLLIHILGDYGTVSFYKKPTYIIITLGFLAVSMAKRGENENER